MGLPARVKVGPLVYAVGVRERLFADGQEFWGQCDHDEQEILLSARARGE